MWKCPRCGREFKNTNQSHYCGEKPKSFEEYILSQDDDKQADLRLLWIILSENLPETEERIAWSMPTFWKQHNIINFAASKKHIGLYVGVAAVEAFSSELSAYKTDKGTIKIPYGQINPELIGRIAKWCLETSNNV